MISPTWVETELMRRNVAQVVEREGKRRTPEEAMAEIARGNPQQRMLQPQEIAALAVFLCSDLARASPWKTYRSPAEPCGSVSDAQPADLSADALL